MFYYHEVSRQLQHVVVICSSSTNLKRIKFQIMKWLD